MHREYHPDDMHHLRAHAFGEDHHHHEHDHDGHHHHDDHRPLFAFTVLLGLLIGADVLFAWLGLPAYRRPGGVSLIWVAALLGAGRIVYGAIAALAEGRLGADFALAQACVAALLLREPFVAAEVVFIALVGEALEAITADRAMKAIGRLFEATPRTARVRRDGEEREIPIGEVRVGDTLLVAPGDRIAADGTVLLGRTAVDEALLTGEPHPIDKGPGEPVHAGTINQFGAIEVRADRVGGATTLGQVMRYVADAQRKKSHLQRAADRYARWFLPVVQVAAGLTLLAGYLLGWPDVWHRTVAILVVACPCALVLATPAAIMASLAWLARHGVVAKGGAAIERLAECDTIAFDKTGTLTRGHPELASVVPLSDWSEADLLRLAATAESASRHPIAASIRDAAGSRGVAPWVPNEATALPGAGVEAAWQPSPNEANRSILVGNRRLMAERGVFLNEPTDAAIAELDARGETPLLVALDGTILGALGVRDAVRPEAHDVIHDLKHLRFTEVALLTGDAVGAAKAVAKRTHIKVVESGLRPEEKAAWVRERQEAGRRVVMIGDGINDAPALATAHVGIALGKVGSDLAAEAGDMVSLGEPLRPLPDLVRLSRKTVAILRQNILGFAFGLNATAIAAAALGWLGPVPAAILHQAGSLLVLLNSMRLLAFGEWRELGPIRWVLSWGGAIRRLDERLDPGRLLAAQAARWGWLAAAGGAAVALLYATSGWVAIAPDEVGLLQRHGRYVGRLAPGLHLRLPSPFERVVRLKPDALRSVEVGFRTSWSEAPARWEAPHDRNTTALRADEGLLMTGDGQLVELAAVAQFRLDDDPEALRRYAFGAFEPEAAVRPLVESSVRSIVSRSKLDDLLGEARRSAERAAADRLRQHVEAYGLGLDVVAVAFADLHPPLPVVEAYRDVSKAESDRLRRTNEGEAARVEIVERARGQAAAVVESAEAQREGRIARAGGEADRFLARHAARVGASALTDNRLYWDGIEASLAGKRKVVLDPSESNRRHLIFSDPLSAPIPEAIVP
jgi:Cu+-exporting ATPase